jgi:hypothetical protein
MISLCRLAYVRHLVFTFRVQAHFFVVELPGGTSKITNDIVVTHINSKATLLQEHVARKAS